MPEETKLEPIESFEQIKDTTPPIAKQTGHGFGVPITGARLALSDIKKQLSDDEMAQSGVVKLLLELLQESDNDRESLRPFVNQYYFADKNAAVLIEKLKTYKSIEVFFGVGLGLGGVIIGLSPFFWALKPFYGFITGSIGFLLILGAVVGKLVKK